MASEAGNLASENATKRPDDDDAAAKSQEQGQKLSKVSGDLTSMDTAIGQTKARAEGLVQGTVYRTAYGGHFEYEWCLVPTRG